MAISSPRFNGLSLCSGIGGLELGLHIAEADYRTCCYVERDAYAAAALVARMAETALDEAPLWSDVRTFDGRPWRGKLDILSAGYPCQPFTFSGKRGGKEDPRHLWPQVKRIISECAPEYVFCENVEGHLSLGFPEVARSLQTLGYSVRAGLFSAAETGAGHIRRRLFILAHAHGWHERQSTGISREGGGFTLHGERQNQRLTDSPDRSGQSMDVLLASGQGLRLQSGQGAAFSLFAPAPCEYQRWEQALKRQPHLQPCLFGLDHGLANRVERFMLAGNGVSPLAAAHAFRTLKSGTDPSKGLVNHEK